MNPTRSMKKPVFGLFVLLTLCVPLRVRRSCPDGQDQRHRGTRSLQKTERGRSLPAVPINNVFNYYGNNGDGSYQQIQHEQRRVRILQRDREDGHIRRRRCLGRVSQGVHDAGLPREHHSAGKGRRVGIPPRTLRRPHRHVRDGDDDPSATIATNPANRVYRVRPDINPKTAFADVQAKIQSEEVAYIARYESYSCAGHLYPVHQRLEPVACGRRRTVHLRTGATRPSCRMIRRSIFRDSRDLIRRSGT